MWKVCQKCLTRPDSSLTCKCQSSSVTVWFSFLMLNSKCPKWNVCYCGILESTWSDMRPAYIPLSLCPVLDWAIEAGHLNKCKLWYMQELARCLLIGNSESHWCLHNVLIFHNWYYCITCSWNQMYALKLLVPKLYFSCVGLQLRG